MSAPTREEVNEMERLRKILNGEKVDAKPLPTQSGNQSQNEIFTPQQGPTQQDVNAMARIMESFSNTTGVKSYKSAHDGVDFNKTVEKIVNKAQHDNDLRESLITQKTETGVRIGAWEIRKALRESPTGRKETVYKVYNTDTNQSIKASFLVLESARAIIKLLNNGAPMGHKIIKEIARLEMEYRRQRKQALEEKIFWQRAKKAKNEMKQHLYEAKFDAAQSRALLTKEQIKSIYHRVCQD